MAAGAFAKHHPATAASLILVGGLAVVSGSFLDWFRFSFFGGFVGRMAERTSVKGVDLAGGKVALAAGIVAVAAGVLALLTNSARGRAAQGLLVLFAGLAAGAESLYFGLAEKSKVIAEAVARAPVAQQGRTRALLNRMFDIGMLRLQWRPGIVLVLAGAAVLLVGAFALMLSNVPARSVDQPGPAAGGPIPPTEPPPPTPPEPPPPGPPEPVPPGPPVPQPPLPEPSPPGPFPPP